jgi:hypothetical protein
VFAFGSIVLIAFRSQIFLAPNAGRPWWSRATMSAEVT